MYIIFTILETRLITFHYIYILYIYSQYPARKCLFNPNKAMQFVKNKQT